MFRALNLALDFLAEPGSQARLAWRVRLGRASRAGEAVFPAQQSRWERDLHEALEDEIFQAIEREEEQQLEMAEIGMAMFASCVSDSE